MAEFKLGERIQFTHQLARIRNSMGKKRVWQPIEYAYGPSKGVIVGKRTLYDGTVEWGYDDEPTIFYRENHFEAYLVVMDLRQKPFPVLPIHLTRLEGDLLDDRPEIPASGIQPPPNEGTAAELDHRDHHGSLAHH